MAELRSSYWFVLLILSERLAHVSQRRPIPGYTIGFDIQRAGFVLLFWI